MKLSVVISAYNEEQKITDCLESIKWIDEIIFVDNTSQDTTVELAKKYTRKIFTQPNNLMLNTNKNYGFAKATGDWILNLDADERVTPELKKEIESKIKDQKSEISGFWIPRKNIIFGKWIKSDMWWPDYQLRLFKKDTGKFPEKHVHEYIEISGKTDKLNETLLHYNYSSISQFIYKMDKIYTEDEVKRIIASQKQLNWIDAIRLPFDDFLKTFFAKKGYVDGLHGLILSILQAFSKELVFIKVWEKQGFKEENSKSFLQDIIGEYKKANSELKYWFFTSLIRKTKNPLKQAIYRLLRKYE